MFLFFTTPYKAIAQYDTKSLISSGLNLVQNKEYSKALVKFNKAIYVKPYLFEPYFYRAYTKYILGDYFGAEKDFNEALEINPYYPEAFQCNIKKENYKALGYTEKQIGIGDKIAISDIFS